MYERFFGLGDAPFRLTPDPRYLFLSRKHADALAHLRLGLSESSGFVCITGDVGTGKTTVLRHFLGELTPEASVAYVVNPTLSPLELLQTINLEFGLPGGDSKKQLIDRLNRHLLEQRHANRCSVVVVDEAQALSMEVLEHLRLLSNLETTTEKLLRIVLVGQPQLRAMLSHPELAQLNQRITLRWHIGPLDREETIAYVRHRLQVASDGQVRDVFSMPALRAVHRRSHGVPRLINMLCHRAMLAAFAAERRTVGLASMRKAYREVVTLPLPGRAPSKPRAAWAAGAVAVAAGIAGLLAGGFGVPPLLRTMTQGSALPVSAVVASAAPDPAPEEPVAALAPDPMSTELDATADAPAPDDAAADAPAAGRGRRDAAGRGAASAGAGSHPRGRGAARGARTRRQRASGARRRAARVAGATPRRRGAGHDGGLHAHRRAAWARASRAHRQHGDAAPARRPGGARAAAAGRDRAALCRARSRCATVCPCSRSAMERPPP